MGRLVVDYFSRAYKKDNSMGNQVIKRSLINTIPQVLGEVENNNILGNILEEEVTRAMFSMKAYKAPRPDGFPQCFFSNSGRSLKVG